VFPWQLAPQGQAQTYSPMLTHMYSPIRGVRGVIVLHRLHSSTNLRCRAGAKGEGRGREGGPCLSGIVRPAAGVCRSPRGPFICQLPLWFYIATKQDTETLVLLI
jgi:hypothetical protein